MTRVSGSSVDGVGGHEAGTDSRPFKPRDECLNSEGGSVAGGEKQRDARSGTKLTPPGRARGPSDSVSPADPCSGLRPGSAPGALGSVVENQSPRPSK